VQAKTGQYIQEGDSVALLGDYKDSSSYYLKFFPQWEFAPISENYVMNATEIRKHLFNVDPARTWEGKITNPPNLKDISSLVPVPVLAYLKEFIKTHEYASLVKEYKFIEDYKQKWAFTPFPPTFVTVDAVVVCGGHVLVVRRKFNPGEGLWALPGGFIRGTERIKDAMLRELKEETGIRVDKLVLEGSVVDSGVFDHPMRSSRGRTITHAYHIKLNNSKLPEVKGSDDASHAKWLPLMDVNKHEDRFYEDHVHIINSFINRN
jgi:bifunctional NMN adenylyltransferase/nudix hydrolase